MNGWGTAAGFKIHTALAADNDLNSCSSEYDCNERNLNWMALHSLTWLTNALNRPIECTMSKDVTNTNSMQLAISDIKIT